MLDRCSLSQMIVKLCLQHDGLCRAGQSATADSLFVPDLPTPRAPSKATRTSGSDGRRSTPPADCSNRPGSDGDEFCRAWPMFAEVVGDRNSAGRRTDEWWDCGGVVVVDIIATTLTSQQHCAAHLRQRASTVHVTICEAYNRPYEHSLLYNRLGELCKWAQPSGAWAVQPGRLWRH